MRKELDRFTSHSDAYFMAFVCCGWASISRLNERVPEWERERKREEIGNSERKV